MKLKLLFLFSCILALTGSANAFETVSHISNNTLDSEMNFATLQCDAPTNIQFNYESQMVVAELSWTGDTPSHGWIVLYGYENTIDINWFLSDPQGYENPEAHIDYINTNIHYLYMNMFHPGHYEIYVVANCGEGLLAASDAFIFEMQERGEEIIDEGCTTPYNVSGVQNDPETIDLSWEPNDGGLYQIAWGPFGLEMNESFFDDPQTGSVIVSENPYHLRFPKPGAQEPHSVFIRKYCGDHVFSNWVIPECHPPSNLQSEMTETEVILTWEPAGDEFAWQLVYAPAGFDPDDLGNPELTLFNIYDNPIQTLTLLNIPQGVNFEFYVRTNCSGNDFSPWAGPGTFETEFLPCNPPENTLVSHVTPYSADIKWTAASGENEWDVLYGPAPLDVNEALVVHVTGTSKTILTGLTPDTDYEVFVVAKCPSGATADGEWMSFTTIEEDIYCFPYFLNGCVYGALDHLILDGENNTRIYDINTGCTDSNYYFNTEETAELAPGNQYFVRIDDGNFTISGHQLAIWIDFNDDGVFDESERVGYGPISSAGFTNIYFEIPEAAPAGAHRMRVMLGFTAYAEQLNPCNEGPVTTNGEVHDYIIQILDLEECNEVSAGTVIQDFQICAGQGFAISTEGASVPAEHLIRGWQSSPANQNNWTHLTDGMLPTTYVYDGIQQATDYRYVVSCTLSGQESISNILRVTMSNLCYCQPESTCSGPGGLQINHVVLVGETVLLDNESGCGGNGYSDYTIRFAPDLKQEETYTLNITANNANLNDDKIKAWIDYNDNKIFDENEVIMDFPGGLPGYTVTSNFTIPAEVPPGLYRMRVRIGWWGSPTLQGCSPLGWGETEDYLIEVIPGENYQVCVDPSEIVVEQEEDPTIAQVSWTAEGEENQWQVVYGPTGFNPEEGDPLEINGEPTTLLTNLEPETTYDVYVRAVCDTDLFSDWLGPKTFTTGSLSLENNLWNSLSYYPVPVENILYLQAMTPIDEVKVYGVSGRLLIHLIPGTNDLELDIEALGSGIYFMEVNIQGNSKILKIIKN